MSSSTTGQGESPGVTGNVLTDRSEKVPRHSVTGCPEFDYSPHQPNLFKMMLFKQAHIAESGIDLAYRKFQETFSCSGRGQLVRRPIISEHAHAQCSAEVFLETAPAGQVFTNEPPEVHGEGNHRTISGVTRSQYVACFRDARVRGRSATVIVDEKVLLDFQADERVRLDDELQWDAAIFHAEGDHALCLPPRDSGAPIEMDEAYSLLGAHTDFFGHWMVEYLPKYAAARLSERLPVGLPVLIDAHMPATHRESLSVLFGRDTKIIEVPAFVEVRLKRLWISPTSYYMPLHEKRNEKFSFDAVALCPQRFAPIVDDLQRRADEALGAEPGDDQRIFLARKSFRHRKLLNTRSVEALAAEQGFQIVYPEDHGFAEQVRFVRGADCLIAPEGSAIFLAMFARHGSRLLILSHPFTDVLVDYNAMLAGQGVQVSALTGPARNINERTPHDSDYEIDLDAMSAVLQGLAQE
jgi:capsular polysaccharide biosynthesis protein